MRNGKSGNPYKKMGNIEKDFYLSINKARKGQKMLLERQCAHAHGYTCTYIPMQYRITCIQSCILSH